MSDASKTKKIAAVVVTYNRIDYLRRLVTKLETIPELDAILIIDNASTDRTSEWLAQRSDNRIRLRILRENLGGAGGFQAGLQWAYDLGFDFVWLMDDDGLPADNCLSKLLSYSESYDFVGPAVLAEQKPTDLCFPVRPPHQTTAHKTLASLEKVAVNHVVDGVVIPFNGVLINRTLVEKIGVPRAEFFIWGDDVEYLWRVMHNDARVGTVVTAHFLHPATDELGTPIMFGKTTYNHSPSDLKHYCMVRNNTRNLIDYRTPLHVLGFWLKTLWFYSFVKPSLPRLLLSLRAAIAGIKSDFSGHQQFIKH